MGDSLQEEGGVADTAEAERDALWIFFVTTVPCPENNCMYRVRGANYKQLRFSFGNI